MKKIQNVQKVFEKRHVTSPHVNYLNKRSYVNNMLKLNKKLSYFFGLQGDRDGRSGVVGISNTNIGILKEVYNILHSSLKQPIERIYILFQFKNKKELEIVNKIVKELNFRKENVRIDINPKQKGNLSMRIYVKNTPLRKHLDNSEDLIRDTIFNSSEEIKLSYLAGKFDAEGSIDSLLRQFRIRSYNKDELIYDAKVLESVGFENKIIPNSNKRFDGWHLTIGYSDISIFQKLAKLLFPFIYHGKKKKIMKNILEGNFISKRENEVLKILKFKNNLTTKKLMKISNLSEFTSWLILRNLHSIGLVKRYRKGHFYVYHT